MANFNDMDALELPNLDELDSDLPPADNFSSSSSNLSEEYIEFSSEAPDEEISVENIVFEEMGGGLPQQAATKAEEKKPSAVSLSKPLDDMQDARQPAASHAAQPSQKANTYQQTSASHYQSVAGKSSYSQPTVTRDNLLDTIYEEKRQNYEKGKGKAKVMGIIVIVFAALDFLTSITNFRSLIFSGIFLALIIYYVLRFMKGSNKARRNIGILMVIDFISSIIGIITASSYSSEFSSYGLGIITDLVTVGLVISAIFYGIFSYFFLFDKHVAEFTIDD